MTEADGDKTPHERAKARVGELLADATQEAADAGFVFGFGLGEIVAAVEDEIGDAALRLPRYYPADEGQAWPLGQARRVDPDTGRPPNVYVTWRTGLPSGRVHLRIVEAGSAQEAAREDATLMADLVAAPETLPHTLRALLAACEHSPAATVVTAGDAR